MLTFMLVAYIAHAEDGKSPESDIITDQVRERRRHSQHPMSFSQSQFHAFLPALNFIATHGPTVTRPLPGQ
jgi:hypothetical protein